MIRRAPAKGSWVLVGDVKRQVEAVVGLDRVRCSDGTVHHVDACEPCLAPVRALKGSRGSVALLRGGV